MFCAHGLNQGGLGAISLKQTDEAGFTQKTLAVHADALLLENRARAEQRHSSQRTTAKPH